MSDARNQLRRPGAKTITAVALGALMVFEGFRSMPYQDQVGVWTDGYGNTHGVVIGKPVSEPQARVRLQEHVDTFTQGILKCLDPHQPTQGQLDSFVLVGYNTGLGAKGRADGFCWLKNGYHSTIVRRFKAGDELGACLGMLAWVRAGGQFNRGLYNRRWQEYNMCLEGTPVFNRYGPR